MVEGPRWKRIRRAALRGLRRAEIKSYRSKELICLSFSLFSLSFHLSPSPPLSQYIYHSSFRSLLLLQLVLSVSLLESGNGNIDDVHEVVSAVRVAYERRNDFRCDDHEDKDRPRCVIFSRRRWR